MWVIVAGVLRDVHAGRLRVPRDRLLARQERRHRGGEGPDELLDRRLAYWAVRLRLRVRRPATSSVTHGFFLQDFGDPQTAFPIMGLSDATVEAKWFFQFVFCAVSLAIVWGTTLERIKFGVYAIYAVDLRGAHLPDRLALGLRRRLAAVEPRHAGLRRLDGRPPDRRHRRARGAAAPRAAARQVRARRQTAADPRPQHAAVRPVDLHPLVRLVRLQPGLDAQRARRPLHRGRGHHAARRLRRRADGDRHRQAA